MTSEPDIVIIGGGSAGIGAARRLSASGLAATLLEATSRIGGRAWTAEAGGMPLDLGCGWLHSADRNAWTGIAEAAGFAVDRRASAWNTQYRDLGFAPAEQDEADRAFAAWNERMARSPPASDRAADALEPADPWNAYLEALSGYISGAPLDRISVADYTTYDRASTHCNWRVRAGYGTLISASLPSGLDLRLSTPVEAITLDGPGVTVATPAGTIRARAVILTVSTAVLSGDTIRLPSALDPWRQAASNLPLGRDEKLFLEIEGGGPFEAETHLIGNPRLARTGAYYIRPFGQPVIECFFGGEAAGIIAAEGAPAGFAHALDELAALFGAGARRHLRPLVASHWSRSMRIGGAYSHALPGHAPARQVLGRPFEDRLFLAGEATNLRDFSTAHGAHDSGVRAADEVIGALRRATPPVVARTHGAVR